MQPASKLCRNCGKLNPISNYPYRSNPVCLDCHRVNAYANPYKKPRTEKQLASLRKAQKRLKEIAQENK